MLILKIGIYVLSMVLLVAIIFVGFMGQESRRARKTGGRDVFNETFHEYGAKICFWLACSIVLLIEGILTLKYGFHRPHLAGFTLHFWSGSLPFAILILTCVFWITGLRSQRWHRFVAYPCIATTTWMAITGDLLVYRL